MNTYKSKNCKYIYVDTNRNSSSQAVLWRHFNYIRSIFLHGVQVYMDHKQINK